MSAPNLLTLGDVTITTEDVALLMPPAWLNDQIISFWLEHLRLHILNSNPSVAILLPNLVYFLNLCPSDHLPSLISSLDIPSKRLVLLPLNDADTISSSKPAGSHWSLLIFQPHLNNYLYLDSLFSRPNLRIATSLSERITASLKLSKPTFTQIPIPAQQNSYDCGAYLCLFAEHAVRHYLTDDATMHRLYSDTPPPTATDVELKRQKIGQLACELIEQQSNKDEKSRL